MRSSMQLMPMWPKPFSMTALLLSLILWPSVLPICLRRRSFSTFLGLGEIWLIPLILVTTAKRGLSGTKKLPWALAEAIWLARTFLSLAYSAAYFLALAMMARRLTTASFLA